MKLRINDKEMEVDAEGDTPLLWVLRDDLGMTGTKYGCGLAQCGACSVLVDGVVTRSCVTPLDAVASSAITTIEAIEETDLGKRVVDAWIRHQVPQCGYCQSGQVMAATSLLSETAKPSDDDIRAAMINLCRCGTYNAIKAAMKDLAGTSEHADGGEGMDIGTGAMVAGGVAVAAAAVGGTLAVRSSGRNNKTGGEGDA
ncbi:(2Fe-2S)-binding protein [Novosphingobium pentaromativorans]|uniref:(2Fe-2S)-binding domain protein n=1 Tax=Novosphingobium pentaromativorans US6-1 TaxID=1088721 RepID=G6EGW6_9SPHN|nr:(2Fe-2S)-binding protein [Novosphingobium pentaromativorans]AIT82042.1 2Fe-2S ferredoxin [Novosphingobium pentaromativorans US6-1]EHJ59255.1 (2Fe-2S)-binding domain protein [Novosphingobium pentaromativorans US6-1]